jgi:dolichyl-phosphate-mannose-protein mannosyltransferase
VIGQLLSGGIRQLMAAITLTGLHPPLAKYTQAISIWIGREVFNSSSPFWWRLPSALFGVGTVWLVMAMVQRMGSILFPAQKRDSKFVAKNILYGSAFAGLVVATEGLLLVQSRIAMNDALLGFLVTLAGWLVLRTTSLQAMSVRTVWLVAVVIGLAMATKWTGVFVWLVLSGWFSISLIGLVALRRIGDWRLAVVRLLFILVLPWLVYLLSYAPAALTHQGYAHVYALHQQAWLYHLNRDSNHAYASRPWQWVANVRPVWYWQDQSLLLPNSALKNNYLSANIYAVSHPLLPLVGLISLGWAIHTILVSKNRAILFWRLLVVCCMYFSVWVPWLFSPRIMFYYHYLPAIPLLAVLIGVWFMSILLSKNAIVRRSAATLVCAWVLIAALWLPHWYGLRVPKELVDTIYFGLPGWR